MGLPQPWRQLKIQKKNPKRPQPNLPQLGPIVAPGSEPFLVHSAPHCFLWEIPVQKRLQNSVHWGTGKVISNSFSQAAISTMELAACIVFPPLTFPLFFQLRFLGFLSCYFPPRHDTIWASPFFSGSLASCWEHCRKNYSQFICLPAN